MTDDDDHYQYVRPDGSLRALALREILHEKMGLHVEHPLARVYAFVDDYDGGDALHAANLDPVPSQPTDTNWRHNVRAVLSNNAEFVNVRRGVWKRVS